MFLLGCVYNRSTSSVNPLCLYSNNPDPKPKSNECPIIVSDNDKVPTTVLCI